MNIQPLDLCVVTDLHSYENDLWNMPSYPKLMSANGQPYAVRSEDWGFRVGFKCFDYRPGLTWKHGPEVDIDRAVEDIQRMRSSDTAPKGLATVLMILHIDTLKSQTAPALAMRVATNKEFLEESRFLLVVHDLKSGKAPELTHEDYQTHLLDVWDSLGTVGTVAELVAFLDAELFRRVVPVPRMTIADAELSIGAALVLTAEPTEGDTLQEEVTELDEEDLE